MVAIALICLGIVVAVCVYKAYIFRKYFNVPEEKPETRCTYYCIKYPPDIGLVPFYGMVESIDYGERRYIPDIDRMAWGRVVYNRELGYHEMSDFGLISEPKE